MAVMITVLHLRISRLKLLIVLLTLILHVRPLCGESNEHIERFRILDEFGAAFEIKIIERPSRTRLSLVLSAGGKKIDNVEIQCDSRGVDSAGILANRFLWITQDVRAGSGEGAKITKLYLIKHSRLHECLVLPTWNASNHKEDFIWRSDSLRASAPIESFFAKFEIGFGIRRIKYSNKSRYQLMLRESTYVASSHDLRSQPIRIESWARDWDIPLDVSDSIFWNNDTTLDGKWMIRRHQNQSDTIVIFSNKIVKGVFLSKERLVMVDDRWFQILDGDVLDASVATSRTIEGYTKAFIYER